MPQWIHDRARHIQSKNPSMPESEAFAIATQQAHATGNSPKGYGTAKARKKAKKKYPTPGDDEQQAKPTEKKAMLSIMKDAFLDELEKIAADEKEKKKRKSTHPNLTQFAKGTLVNMGMLGGNSLSGAAMEGLMEQGNEPLFNAVKNKMPADIKFTDEELPLNIGPHFAAGKSGPLASLGTGNHEPYVATAGSKNPAILGHELGHVDINNNRLGRIVQNPITTRLGGHAANIGTLTGMATGGLSDDERVRKAGVLAPLALSAPQLAYEAAASIQGLRRMRGAGANTKELLHGAKTLIPGFTSYATRAGLGVGNAMQGQAIGGALRDRKKRQDKKKKAEE